MIQWGDFLIDPREGEDLCRMAVLLAMTVDQKMERDLILQLQKRRIPFIEPVQKRCHHRGRVWYFFSKQYHSQRSEFMLEYKYH